MKKISCKVINDLLPLYCDNICSNETRDIVLEHLKHCSACRQKLKNMQGEIAIPKNYIDDNNILINLKKVFNAKLIKSVIRDLIIIIVFLLLTLLTLYLLLYPFFKTDIEKLDFYFCEDENFYNQIKLKINLNKNKVIKTTNNNVDNNAYIYFYNSLLDNPSFNTVDYPDSDYDAIYYFPNDINAIYYDNEIIYKNGDSLNKCK